MAFAYIMRSSFWFHPFPSAFPPFHSHAHPHTQRPPLHPLPFQKPHSLSHEKPEQRSHHSNNTHHPFYPQTMASETISTHTVGNDATTTIVTRTTTIVSEHEEIHAEPVENEPHLAGVVKG